MSADVPGLIDWMSNPREDRTIRFLEDDDVVEVSYAELSAQAQQFARGLHARFGPDIGRVVLVLASPREFAIACFGTLWAGGCIVPVAAPMPLQREEEYAAHIGPILASSKPDLIVHAAEGLGPHGADITRLSLEPILAAGADGAAEGPGLRRDRPVILQYTSGSTGTPKGVEIRAEDVEAQAGMAPSYMRYTEKDCVAGWLPMHHDLGLIATLLVSAMYQVNSILFDPLLFARRPSIWLDCFGSMGATISMSPPIGYDMAARALAKWEGDLSGWRSAFIGAEPVDPLRMAKFMAVAKPFGFRPEALSPAYGLAEATLIATGSDWAEPARCAALADDERPFFGAHVVVDEVVDVTETLDEDRVWIASSGRPLLGISVQVVDDEGAVVEDDIVGRIQVRTPSRTLGYFDDGVPRASRDEWLETGDAGFLHEGELYVLGRIADRLKVRGQALSAEDLEIRLVHRTGVHPQSLLVLPALKAGGQGVTVFWEGEGHPKRETLAPALSDAVRASCGSDVDVEVIVVPRGSIPRTTSGKPRRHRAWMDLHARQEPVSSASSR